MKKAQDIVRELERRATYFERRYNRTKDSFDVGAGSNLRAIAIWAGSKQPSKLKEDAAEAEKEAKGSI